MQARAVPLAAKHSERFDDAVSMPEDAARVLLFLPQDALTQLDELPGKAVSDGAMAGMKMMQPFFEPIQR